MTASGGQPGGSNKAGPKTVLGNPNPTVGLRKDIPIAGLGVAYPREVAGTTDTLSADDNGGGVQYLSGSDVTVTVPAGLEDFECFLIQMDAGIVTPTTDGTTVIANRQSHTGTAGQYAVVSLIATSADNFVMGGDTA